jgi:hypothetical protein
MRDNTLDDLRRELRGIKRHLDERVTVVRVVYDPEKRREGERILRGSFQRTTEDEEK